MQTFGLVFMLGIDEEATDAKSVKNLITSALTCRIHGLGLNNSNLNIRHLKQF